VVGQGTQQKQLQPISHPHKETGVEIQPILLIHTGLVAAVELEQQERQRQATGEQGSPQA